jgi:hypothetical protein
MGLVTIRLKRAGGRPSHRAIAPADLPRTVLSHVPSSQRMAYAQERPGMTGSINEHASALATEWRRLTRAATFVALLTAPAFFLVLFDSNHWSLVAALIVTALAVVMFRGLVEVLTRRFIPSPSLYGADATLKEQDIVARRRYWFWRGKLRRLPIYVLIVGALLALCQVFFSFAGVSAPFFKPFTGLRQVFPPDTLPQLGLVFVQLPLLFFVNFAIFFGPFLFFAVRQIRGYEPGDASGGVKIEDVRGQAEAKEEITRVITLWQSGEEFEKAGGKRERGLLFLGAPGTGKTMISKAIATNFNCPFVTIPGSGFAGMFIGMDAITVQFLARKARKLAAKWGGQCIVFIDEIDAVGMRRQALGSGIGAGMQAAEASSIHDLCFYGPNGSITASGDLVIESRAWREKLFAQRAETPASGYATFVQRASEKLQRLYPGFGMGGGGGMALNQLLIVMDGIDEPPLFRKFVTNRVNTFLDAMFVIPGRIGKLRFRLPPPRPRKEQIYFIGACNVPIQVLDPALTRPGRMGRHIWFRTPTKDDRLDIPHHRAHRGAARVRVARHRRGDDDRRDRDRAEHRVHPGGNPRRGHPRGRSRRRRSRLPREGRPLHAPLDPQARRLARALPEHGEGRAVLTLPRPRHGRADHDPRGDGRRTRLLRRELAGRRRRRAERDRHRRRDGGHVGDGP